MAQASQPPLTLCHAPRVPPFPPPQSTMMTSIASNPFAIIHTLPYDICRLP